jgi:hypothetical protein
MAAYAYPTSIELQQVEQKYLPVLTADNPFFSMFPFKNIDKSILEWEQQDNYIGLQQVRGLNGAPSRVAKVGVKQYMMKPGVYGEYVPVDEEEITNRRRMGSLSDPVDIYDLVRAGQDQLLTRRLMRQKKLIVDLVVYGFFSIIDKNGVVSHTDGYTQRVFASTTPWSTAATSTPLADMRAVKLLQRGYSMRLGAGASAWMNQTTANYILANSNSADVGGKRTGGFRGYGGNTVNGVADLNALLTGDDLPTIKVWDEGYYDDSGTFQLDIPTGYVIVEGKRATGTPIGHFCYTRNANNPGAAPGPYMRVIDRMETPVPRTIEVHDGFNGGPAVYFPSALIVMKVG